MTFTQFANFMRTLTGTSAQMTVAEMTTAVGTHAPLGNQDSAFIDRSIVALAIPSGVTSIGNYAFSNCGRLALITIPSGVTKIGYDAFSYCTGLTSITIPSGVTSIGSRAFYYCTGLTSITIPSSVTRIDGSAFSGTNLTSIIIPYGVTSIGQYAFSTCSSLTSITISSSVTSIGYDAFGSCPRLTDIYCGFAEGAVSGAPWGATNATIHYNSQGPA